MNIWTWINFVLICVVAGQGLATVSAKLHEIRDKPGEEDAATRMRLRYQIAGIGVGMLGLVCIAVALVLHDLGMT